MKLYEHEGKDLFEGAGIPLASRQLISKMDLPEIELKFPLMAKAQVLSGKRGLRGLVASIETKPELKTFVDEYLDKTIDDEVVKKVLIEDKINIAAEYFVSITYSTVSRGPVLLISEQGGTAVETDAVVSDFALRFGEPIPDIGWSDKLTEVVQKLWELFQEKDLFLAEINPLVETPNGKVFALDAKVVTDDAAGFRQNWDLPERNMLGKDKSWAELESEKIDETDHRGVVGRVYLDLPGDVGVIAAGGGASLVAMDAMVTFGLKPANYTEFSGNPPGYKVERLAEIVLAKPDLVGAILVGGKANFTDQLETLSGFAEALRKIKPKYPIVVRRDGPNMAEAKVMLEKLGKELGLDLYVYDESTSIIETIQILKELVS